PCIIIDNGVHVFSSSRLAHGASYEGYCIAPKGQAHEGKIVRASDGKRPFDISITKNVCGLIIDSIILVVLILLCARWYRKHDVLKEAPTGLAALLEPVIMTIENDVIKDAVGPDYKRFSPYLLTAFFFILINNLMGIFPVFPGGANITGNIAVTFVLAMFTFLMVNLFGNKHYWKDILWPDVPVFLKAIPLMPAIEILGMFTKPFSLMIRLFANMLAGHIMLLSTVALIFLTAKMGAVLNGSLSFVAVVLGIFLDCLEVLVAFIQAYVFTMLSSVFIGLAHQHPEGETH
ncbi:MAG: F0F1 ATP synthase subunit A, partial [Bacteroidales bacterium]|nr:F0F1 ATP synthase subunit A [Bacteroidales bacterium]